LAVSPFSGASRIPRAWGSSSSWAAVVSATLDLHGPNSQGEAPAHPPRWLFRVVDVVSGTSIVDDADARTTVDALASVDSIFDVLIFVCTPELTTWRQLTPGEQRILWDFRER
jgi:hypothetical protein